MPCYGTPRVRVLECPPLGRPSLIKLVLVNKVGPCQNKVSSPGAGPLFMGGELTLSGCATLSMEFGPGVSELSSLSSAEDTALLENTRQRYDASHIYTRSGRLLLAVNPYRKLNCYSDKVLEQYKASLQPQAELPPHVYAVASSAHLGMMQNSQSQVPFQGTAHLCSSHRPQNTLRPQPAECISPITCTDRHLLHPAVSCHLW